MCGGAITYPSTLRSIWEVIWIYANKTIFFWIDVMIKKESFGTGAVVVHVSPRQVNRNVFDPLFSHKINEI